MRRLRQWLRRIRRARRRGLRRTFRRRMQRYRERALYWRAERHRRRLATVTFVAVTGSTAKTSTSRTIADILQTAGPCVRSTMNIHRGIARMVLETKPTDRFCVAETATARPGYLDRSVRLVQPRIAVVTNVGSDHRAAFGSPEAIAEEKSKVVAALPPDGVAVLNADDPRVLAMRTRTTARILTYGCGPDAALRGEEMAGAWPDRFSMTVYYGGETARVETRLCGAHWAPTILAALGAAVAAGLPFAAAVAAIARVEPAPARMSVEEHPDGVIFIRDDWKASLPTVWPAIAFMKAAHAPRKIIILGTISDYGGTRWRQYVRVAKAAREAADIVILVGRHATTGLRARAHADDTSVMAFATVRDASQYLDGVLQAGDLVLLKGSNRADHLYRLALARVRAVGCWRSRCGRRISCDRCPLVERPAPPEAVRHDEPQIEGEPPAPATPALARDGGGAAARVAMPDGSHVIVGLGNPGPRFEGTPHNVGQAVVDALAGTLDATWHEDGDAMVGAAVWNGVPVRLVKIATPMNRTGPALRRLSREMGFGAGQIVLVFDDVDLPLGSVRSRMSGSSGGHRGVASVLHEFQTEDIRRVKIGVGRPGGAKAKADFLLVPFGDEERPVIDAARQQAAERVLHLVRSGSPGIGA